MHIIIGIITAIAGLIWALNSLQNAGVNLNAFNPFTWARRRRWEKQLGTKPMHGLTDPVDAAALLVVAIAKAEGEVTRELKMEILALFEKEFDIKRNKSIELFSSSSYMLNNVMNMAAEVNMVLAPTKEQFQQHHIDTLLAMLNAIACAEGDVSDEQTLIIDAVENELRVKH